MKKRMKITGLVILIVVIISVALPLSWSLTESGSVRTAVYFSGHPIKALRCDPKLDLNYKNAYTKKSDRTYTISSTNGFTVKDGSYVADIFVVKKSGIFYHAIPKPDLM